MPVDQGRSSVSAGGTTARDQRDEARMVVRSNNSFPPVKLKLLARAGGAARARALVTLRNLMLGEIPSGETT